MSLAAALSSQKSSLKTTETVVKTASDFDEDKQKKEELKKYVNIWSEVNIEQWVELLGDLTFATKCIPLTKQQASLFVNHWNIINDPMLLPDVKLSRKEEIRAQLADLEHQVDEIVKEFGSAFVKTSSRSPKDTTHFGQRLSHRVQDLLTVTPLHPLYLQKLDDDDDDTPAAQKAEYDEMTRIARCVLQANFDVMKIKDAKLAFDLLLHSNRIYEDMFESLEYGSSFNQSIIVRKWEDIEWQFEFRGFVYNNNLTGLSQYAHQIYLPEVYAKRDHIKDTIVQFWQSNIKQKLEKFQNYVIDFAVYGEDYSKILVIELNPYHDTTNGTLYRWQADAEELKNGPVKLRVRGGHYPRGLQLFSEHYKEFYPVKS